MYLKTKVSNIDRSLINVVNFAVASRKTNEITLSAVNFATFCRLVWGEHDAKGSRRYRGLRVSSRGGCSAEGLMGKT